MEKIIARLFAEFSAMYGKKFADQWSGVDPELLRSVWAEKLSRYIDRPQVIRGALVRCENSPWPPTLPEFLAMCGDESCALARREMDMAVSRPAIPDNRTPEERKEQSRQALAELNRFLQKAKAQA